MGKHYQIELDRLKLWKLRLFVMPDIVANMGNPVGKEIHFAESLIMVKDWQEVARIFSGFESACAKKRKILKNQCFSIMIRANFDT